MIEHYNEHFPETTPFIRGDSGFAVPALYDLFEKESIFYVIRLKSNTILQRLAEEYHPSSALSDCTKTEYYAEETIYQAKKGPNLVENHTPEAIVGTLKKIA